MGAVLGLMGGAAATGTATEALCCAGRLACCACAACSCLTSFFSSLSRCCCGGEKGNGAAGAALPYGKICSLIVMILSIILALASQVCRGMRHHPLFSTRRAACRLQRTNHRRARARGYASRASRGPVARALAPAPARNVRSDRSLSPARPPIGFRDPRRGPTPSRSVFVSVVPRRRRQYFWAEKLTGLDAWTDGCEGHGAAYRASCMGKAAVYRVSAVDALFFLAMAACSAIAPQLHDMHWGTKLFSLGSLLLSAIFLPNAAFVNVYVWIARFGGAFFIVLQQARRRRVVASRRRVASPRRVARAGIVLARPPGARAASRWTVAGSRCAKKSGTDSLSSPVGVKRGTLSSPGWKLWHGVVVRPREVILLDGAHNVNDWFVSRSNAAAADASFSSRWSDGGPLDENLASLLALRWAVYYSSTNTSVVVMSWARKDSLACSR
jgi:hypothetical protein